MAKRKRKHIPLKTKLAAALACLLPQRDRDILRACAVPADDILRRFEWDHVRLHAFGGSDAWQNIDPKLKEVHREKSRRDTSIVAKVKRLRQAPQAVAGKPKPPKGRLDAPGSRRRTTDASKCSWGIPGMRKKVNGEVVRR